MTDRGAEAGTKASCKLPAQAELKENDPGGVNTNGATREIPRNCQQKETRHDDTYG